MGATVNSIVSYYVKDAISVWLSCSSYVLRKQFKNTRYCLELQNHQSHMSLYWQKDHQMRSHGSESRRSPKSLPHLERGRAGRVIRNSTHTRHGVHLQISACFPQTIRWAHHSLINPPPTLAFHICQIYNANSLSIIYVYHMYYIKSYVYMYM